MDFIRKIFGFRVTELSVVEKCLCRRADARANDVFSTSENWKNRGRVRFWTRDIGKLGFCIFSWKLSAKIARVSAERRFSRSRTTFFYLASISLLFAVSYLAKTSLNLTIRRFVLLVCSVWSVDASQDKVSFLRTRLDRLRKLTGEAALYLLIPLCRFCSKIWPAQATLWPGVANALRPINIHIANRELIKSQRYFKRVRRGWEKIGR